MDACVPNVLQVLYNSLRLHISTSQTGHLQHDLLLEAQ